MEDKKKEKEQQTISPELAAKIVRDHILPMFESEGKKSLKNKQNKLNAIGLKGALGTGSVFGELKLSDQLATQLQEV